MLFFYNFDNIFAEFASILIGGILFLLGAFSILRARDTLSLFKLMLGILIMTFAGGIIFIALPHFSNEDTMLIKDGRSAYLSVKYGRNDELKCVNFIGRTSEYRMYWDKANLRVLSIPNSQHISITPVFHEAPTTNTITFSSAERALYQNVTSGPYDLWKEDLLKVCPNAKPTDIEFKKVPCSPKGVMRRSCLVIP